MLNLLGFRDMEISFALRCDELQGLGEGNAPALFFAAGFR